MNGYFEMAMPLILYLLRMLWKKNRKPQFTFLVSWADISSKAVTVELGGCRIHECVLHLRFLTQAEDVK